MMGVLVAMCGCPAPKEPVDTTVKPAVNQPAAGQPAEKPATPKPAPSNPAPQPAEVSQPANAPAPEQRPAEPAAPAAKPTDPMPTVFDPPVSDSASTEPPPSEPRTFELPVSKPLPLEPGGDPVVVADSPKPSGTEDPTNPMFERRELPPEVADEWDPALRGMSLRKRPKPPAQQPATKPATEKAADQPAAEKPSVIPENKPLEKAADKPTETPAEKTPPAVTSSARPRPGKKGGPPFDPIKENGPIFVDWPKPKVALLLSGRQDGYIEPCGCAGLDRMKGGMSRRHSLFNYLHEKGWPVVGLDVGGISKGFGRQAELKFHTMIEGMRKMGFDAVGLGVNELQLPAGELVAVTACVDGQDGMFVSANVGLFGFAADVTPKMKLIKAGGMTIGVTSILGAKYQKTIRNDEIEMSDPATALAEVLVKLKAKADYLVLLSHATREESEAIARKFPEFNLVVSAGDAAEPPSMPAYVANTKTLLVEVGEKGMNAVVLGLYDNARQPVRYQRVPLDSRFPQSDDMKALMRAYQDQLKTLGFAGLNIRPVPHPQAELNGGFVGSKKCDSCHEKSCVVWRKSRHALAYKTLAELDPPRQFDPECISCHVIGWHPTKHFPYEGGYQSLAKTPQLLDVGCESCHGPGEAHCRAEDGKDIELQKKLQKAVRITKEESEKRQCYTCHDLDNSPTFDFKTYWPLIEHIETED